MKMAPELIERRHDSINSLVRAVEGNTKDQEWLSTAIKAGEVVRDEMGRLHLPDPVAELPAADDEPERGTLGWLLDQLWACDEHVSLSYMTEMITHAWGRAADARAVGKHWVVDADSGRGGHWENK